jgi:5-oxoprolinase (ATP-hydrolysing) subunit C
MSTAGLRILSAGPGVTIQDGGRHKFLRFGVTESGPMDRLSHATANRAAGVSLDSATIEVSLGGVELTAEGMALTLSLAGGSFDIRLDGERLPSACTVQVGMGQHLVVRPGLAGAWCYIAVGGKFNLPPALGSVSMHTRSSIGGKQLEARTLVQVIASQVAESMTAEIVAPWLERGRENIRVILGPQNDYFDSAQITAFLESIWTVSNQSDRMAYLLEGPRLEHAKGFNIVSDGTAAGSVQIPGEGRPIVLMADRPPTGGYPKIATIIGADLGRLAQFCPGQKFRFAVTSIEEAVSARRRDTEALAPRILLRPLPHFLRPEFLLSENLVDGVTDGLD